MKNMYCSSQLFELYVFGNYDVIVRMGLGAFF
jgi:hypothetical protein